MQAARERGSEAPAATYARGPEDTTPAYEVGDGGSIPPERAVSVV